MEQPGTGGKSTSLLGVAPRTTGKRLLLAASTGGHLAQLSRFATTFDPETVSWITFDSPQSRSLLKDVENVYFVDYVAPRDWRGVWKVYNFTRKLVQSEPHDIAISTGAAMGFGVLAAARRERIEALYIESVSRLNGPSLTGRILCNARIAETFTQHATWANKHWTLHPSVLDTFESTKKPGTTRTQRIFVTLGTIRPYRFDSMVDAILRSLPNDAEVTWQLGETSRADLPGRSERLIDGPEFESLARGADVVVTHAGVGTILQLLEWGVHPVVVPRRAERDEHVDNHQLQIAEYLRQKHLATVRESPDLDKDDLVSASRLATRASVA